MDNQELETKVVNEELTPEEIKAQEKQEKDAKFTEWLENHNAELKNELAAFEEKGEKPSFGYTLKASGFIDFFVVQWNKLSIYHPQISKLLYEIFFFLVFSNGVTIWQFLVMQFLPYAFADLASVEFIWPQIELWSWGDGTSMVWGLFNEPIKYVTDPITGEFVLNDLGEKIISANGGLGNFIAFEIAVFTAQCINFPLQRNITFKSDGNPVIQAIWYFIGWVAISILVNAVWGFIGPVFEKLITADPVINNLLKTFVTGGLSMFVFFFIFKIIFPEKKEEQEVTE